MSRSRTQQQVPVLQRFVACDQPKKARGSSGIEKTDSFVLNNGAALRSGVAENFMFEADLWNSSSGQGPTAPFSISL